MDETHLTGKYFGTLLGACAYDVNNHIFSITFAIMESEKKDSGTWFLIQLWHEIVNMERGVVIIFDR